MSTGALPRRGEAPPRGASATRTPTARVAPPPPFPALSPRLRKGAWPRRKLWRGGYFRLRYHGGLLRGARREEAAIRGPAAERSGAGLPPQCLVTAQPLVRPAARPLPLALGAPASPRPPATVPLSYARRPAPRPATHPVRGGNARPLSCLFDFRRDNVEWSAEQAAAAERKVQENSTQRVCPEKQGAPRGLSVGSTAQRTAGRALREAREPRLPRAFCSAGLGGRTGDVQGWKWVTPLKSC